MTDSDEGLDILWGVQAIADEIGRPYPATMRLLNQGHLPARKVGKKWCSRRSVLRSHFGNVTAGDANGLSQGRDDE